MPGERQWATQVIRRLGYQPNARNVSNLVGWAKAEGGHNANDARYNYLNTTQPMPGAGNTGTQGNIKVYRNLQQGVEATVKTLKNGRYGGIIQALNGSPQSLASAIDQSPWGTHNPSLASIIASAKVGPAGGGSVRPSSASSVPSSTPTATAPPVAAGPDPALRQQALQAYVSDRHNPNALLSLAAGLQTAEATPEASAAVATPGTVPDTAPRSRVRAPTRGAAAALDWANSKIGDPNSRETGENTGGLASYANKQFGMSNQPWCAMFTSLAVTKGGAPSVARTASVAQVRALASQKKGYRGFVNPAKAKPGDLVLFGNAHIGMVQRVSGGKIFYVGGNQSDNVTQGQTSPGAVDVVRPAYR